MEELFRHPEQDQQSNPTTIQYRFEEYTLANGMKFHLRLVQRHRLWGHHLWNAGKVAGELISFNAKDWIQGKSVIEFGAASALPSLVAASCGARFVCATDYDDVELVENMRFNGEKNSSLLKCPFMATGYIWGNYRANGNDKGEGNECLCEDYQRLLEANGGKPYDFVIMADLVFNHTVRDKLLASCKALIGASSVVLVTFTAHRPHLLEEDLKFITRAKEFGFQAEEMPSWNTGVMFEEDTGDAAIRAKVWVFLLRLSHSK